MPQAVLACAAIYMAVTATGILQAGFNIDDWRDLGGTPARWAEREGRWAMDLIYRYAFAGRPLLPLQVLLAFGNFLAISYLLAKYAVDEASNRPVAVFLIFVTGVNYANMIDILHFNSHVFAFSFALLCSLFAFHAIVNLDRLKSRAAMALVLLASAQMLAASFAIYQRWSQQVVATL